MLTIKLDSDRQHVAVSSIGRATPGGRGSFCSSARQCFFEDLLSTNDLRFSVRKSLKARRGSKKENFRPGRSAKKVRCMSEFLLMMSGRKNNPCLLCSWLSSHKGACELLLFCVLPFWSYTISIRTDYLLQDQDRLLKLKVHIARSAPSHKELYLGETATSTQANILRAPNSKARAKKVLTDWGDCIRKIPKQLAIWSSSFWNFQEM